jgi:hypothetical protein
MSKVSIIYTLIARSSKIVLVDYTEYSGNFQQISLMMLNRIKKNSKCEIQYNEYKFFYEDDNDITFLCMGENLDTDVVFSYLSDLKKSFLTTYEMRIIQNAYSYQLKEFSHKIKHLAKGYETNPSSKLMQLSDKVSQTSAILHENVGKLLQRSEQLNIIAQKSNRLMETSDDFVKNIQEIKRRQKMKKYKLIAMILIVVSLIIGLIYLLS